MLYRLYLFALKEREEYGDKYGDTDELMEQYKKILRENNMIVDEEEKGKVRKRTDI